MTQVEEPAAAVPGADLRAGAVALLSDYLVVAERGANTPAAQAARSALLVAGGQSLVAGTDARAPAADAALVNGIAAHAIELDDTYEPASLHPGVAVWPAAIAVAEEVDATVGDLLRAAVAGYDATCTAGDRLDPAVTYARGFHPTGVCGPLGAAAAAGELLGLDAEERSHARGIAASAAGGLLQFLADGAWTKPLHAGQAAAGGVRAARLAAAGFRGPEDAMEGAHGFLHAFGRRGGEAPDPAPGAGMLATSIKPYPCCRYIHPSLDVLLDLVREGAVQPDDVEHVRLGVLSAGWDLVAAPTAEKQWIAGQVDAQFSLPFAAALALRHGRATLADFEAAPALASGLAPLMARIEAYRSDALDTGYPASWGAEVEVRTRGRAVVARSCADASGSPRRPLSPAGRLAKAAGLIGDERAAQVIAACEEACDATSVRELLADVKRDV